MIYDKLLNVIKTIGNIEIEQAIICAVDEYCTSASNDCKPIVSGALPLTEEKKLELILRKYHGHTKEQWENELVKQYPYCEIPYLIELVWKAAQGNDR